MGPMLASLSDGQQRDTVWLREQLARHFNVSSEERAQLLPKGTGRLYDNRVAWAFTHLYLWGSKTPITLVTCGFARSGRRSDRRESPSLKPE